MLYWRRPADLNYEEGWAVVARGRADAGPIERVNAHGRGQARFAPRDCGV
jgi:hypothetical protein